MAGNVDAVDFARGLAREGKPLPASLASDRQAAAAYRRAGGKAIEQSTDATPDAGGKPETSTEHPQNNDTTNEGGSRPSTRARPTAATPRSAGARTTHTRTRGRTTKTVRGRAVDLATHPATLGTGTGGGLLLAIFIYPLISATLRYGKQGPNAWLSAKFLNKVIIAPGATK